MVQILRNDVQMLIYCIFYTYVQLYYLKIRGNYRKVKLRYYNHLKKSLKFVSIKQRSSSWSLLQNSCLTWEICLQLFDYSDNFFLLIILQVRQKLNVTMVLEFQLNWLWIQRKIYENFKFVSIEQKVKFLVHCAKRPPYKLMRLEHATFPSQKADLKITRGSDFTATKDGLFR